MSNAWYKIVTSTRNLTNPMNKNKLVNEKETNLKVLPEVEVICTSPQSPQSNAFFEGGRAVYNIFMEMS